MLLVRTFLLYDFQNDPYLLNNNDHVLHFYFLHVFGESYSSGKTEALNIFLQRSML